MAAWPRWVASYGVMPQTYIVARAGPARWARPRGRAVSYSASGRPRPAAGGTRSMRQGNGRGRSMPACAMPRPAVNADAEVSRGPQGRERHRRAERLRSAARVWPASLGGAGKRPVGVAAGRPAARAPRPPRGQVRGERRAERRRRRAASAASTGPASAGSGRPPTPTARCAACPRRGSRRRGRPRTGGRRPGSTWPPLRSALLITASKSARRASRGSSAWASTYGWPSSSRRRRLEPAGRDLVGGHEADQRLGVRRLVDPQLARARRPAGRRAAPWAGPGPSRSACGRPDRPRPPGRRACRRGSPTAGVPRATGL